MIDDIVAALGFGDTILIGRSTGAAAEVVGAGPLRRRQEWLPLDDEGAGASHVSLRIADVRDLRFRESGGRNAALDVLGPESGVIRSVSFRRIDPGRAGRFDSGRLAGVNARFGPLVEVAA
jgi:hypothetical protein